MRCGGREARSGFTLLEVEVAFVLLAIGLSGLCPLVVVQLKLSRQLARANPQSGEPAINGATPYLSPDATYYLIPAATTWERKLGVAATLATAPGTPPSTSSTATPVNTVMLSAPVQRSSYQDHVTLQVVVTPVGP